MFTKKKKYGIFLIVSLVILTGCGAMEGKTAGDVEKKTQVLAEGTGRIPIVMTAGNVRVEGVLDDSETSREFLARLPLTISLKRSDDREYYTHIPALSDKGNAIEDYENGDITFYTGGPSLAIFFDKAGFSHQGNLIRMGRITSDLHLFDKLGDSIEMRIERKEPQMEHDVETMKAMYRTMYGYMLYETRNIAGIGEMLDDGFTLTHMTGMVQPKDEYIACIADGRLSYFSQDTEQIDVQLVDETHAILTGQTRVEAEVFGGSRHTWPLQLKFDMEKKNGQWLMMRAVASTY